MDIVDSDRKILRDLAKKQLEMANSEKNKKTEELWFRHNKYQGERPIVTIETYTFADDLLPQRLQCQSEIGRQIEFAMLSRQISFSDFNDDTVIPDYYPMQHWIYIKPFGLDIKVTHSDGIGHHFDPQIFDLEEDYHLLKKTTFHCQDEELQEQMHVAEDAFGDILPVRFEGMSLGCSLTQDIVHLMGMENMFIAMCEAPGLFKEMIDRLADDYIEFYSFLEERNLILPTNRYEHVGQGTYGFNEELPRDKEHYTTHDIWGIMESQETVGVSVDMFEELVFPAYEKVGKCFGLLSYGCCEPVHPAWDRCFSKFKNLRKISISPWCDEHIMGEKLCKSGVIYHRKPDPTILGVGTTLDEDRLRAHIRNTVNCAKGCKIEFSQRDIYQVNHDAEKVRRFIEIIRQESEEAYCK